MRGWRVSKYDPAHRDATGRYTKDEWTSVSDIGKSIGGHALGMEEYLRVEAAYVDTAVAFHVDVGAPILFALDVQGGGSSPNVPGDVVCVPPSTGQAIGHPDLPDLIRSCLREIVWCRLESKDKSCLIHFGYDFYMYLTGTDVPAHAFEVARTRGLFMEPFQSPYLLPA